MKQCYYYIEVNPFLQSLDSFWIMRSVRYIRICRTVGPLARVKGSFHVKSPRVPHDPSQMFPKKLLKNTLMHVLRTQTKFYMLLIISF